MVTPIVQGGKYAPSIYNMAADYAKGAQDNVSQYLGSRGLTSSSFYPQMLEQAFRGGTNQAIQVHQGQQSLYNQWARDIVNLKAQEGAGDQGSNPFMGGLTGAGAGAAIGNKIAPGGAGAGYGALIGGAAGLFGLFD